MDSGTHRLRGVVWPPEYKLPRGVSHDVGTMPEVTAPELTASETHALIASRARLKVYLSRAHTHTHSHSHSRTHTHTHTHALTHSHTHSHTHTHTLTHSHTHHRLLSLAEEGVAAAARTGKRFKRATARPTHSTPTHCPTLEPSRPVDILEPSWELCVLEALSLEGMSVGAMSLQLTVLEAVSPTPHTDKHSSTFHKHSLISCSSAASSALPPSESALCGARS